jgi:hypothetical protein
MIVRTRIDPRAFYDDAGLYDALQIRTRALAQARRAGALRFARKGRRVLYLGRWVLNWLTADTQATGAPRAS